MNRPYGTKAVIHEKQPHGGISQGKENFMRDKEKEKKEKREQNVAMGILGILIVIIAVLLLLKGCKAPAETDAGHMNDGGLVIDKNAEEGGWRGTDTEAVIESLNRKVEEGMINISMNTSPYFEDGDSYGNLMIVNEKTNNHPQIVSIVMNSTGEEIYRSGGIPVGSKIEKAKLGVSLPKGVYECTAMFHSVDENGNDLGCAGAIITVTVAG